MALVKPMLPLRRSPLVAELAADVGALASAAHQPAAAVWRTADGLRVDVDLPGVAREDASATVDGRTLLVEATRRGPDGEEATLVAGHAGEHTVRFRYELPQPVDADAVSARLEHGVLSVDVPTKAASIAIDAGDEA